MKKIFRKNQLVITALALMIAVAGYFSYMNNNMDQSGRGGAHQYDRCQYRLCFGNEIKP